MTSKSVRTKQTASGIKASAPPGLSPLLKPVKDRPTLDLIMDAVSAVDLTKTPAWGKLAILSDRTQFDAIDAVPEGVFTEAENGFAVIATVYVKLDFGGKKGASIPTGSFPAEVHGHFENGTAVIDAVWVNTSSFYA
jgi:hypothetical protein